MLDTIDPAFQRTDIIEFGKIAVAHGVIRLTQHALDQVTNQHDLAACTGKRRNRLTQIMTVEIAAAAFGSLFFRQQRGRHPQQQRR
ncbi:hypothetical protein D3C87_1898520 [compost metagenome]